MGPVNLITGDNRIFNFAETWGGRPSTATLAVKSSGRKVLIVGSEGSSWKRGETLRMTSDQTRRPIGVAIVSKSLTGDFAVDLLEQVRKASGKRALPAYVLK
jgi:hypothetical protein